MTTSAGPVLIVFAGSAFPLFCLQAQFAGPEAPVTLQPVDPNGQTPLQQWAYDGQVISLYEPDGAPQFYLGFIQPASSGQALALAQIEPADQFQFWNWSGTTASTFANAGATGFAIDNEGGVVQAGNKVQIWQAPGNFPNQSWIFALVPGLA